MDNLPWLIAPDWSTPVLERIEWKTDVITAFNGREQRIALRQTPRRWFEFAILIGDDSQRREFEAMLWANGAKAWGLPIYTDSSALDAPVLAGAYRVDVDTRHKDFIHDGQAVLQSGHAFEWVQILTVQPDYLMLAQPISQAFGQNSIITPVRPAYLENNQVINRFTGDSVYTAVRFMLDDMNDHPAEQNTTLYRGQPVLTVPSAWTTDLTVDYQRKMQTVDFGVGGVYRDDESGQPAILSSHHWMLTAREDIDQFRAFLYARRGRLSSIWLPTFLNDLNAQSYSAAQINIDSIEYSARFNFKPNRRDIRILLASGAVQYRRIVACAVVDAHTEQLTVDSPLSPADEIVSISFMSNSRLDADAIELSWQWGDLVNCSLNWRSSNDLSFK